MLGIILIRRLLNPPKMSHPSVEPAAQPGGAGLKGRVACMVNCKSTNRDARDWKTVIGTISELMRQKLTRSSSCDRSSDDKDEDADDEVTVRRMKYVVLNLRSIFIFTPTHGSPIFPFDRPATTTHRFVSLEQNGSGPNWAGRDFGVTKRVSNGDYYSIRGDNGTAPNSRNPRINHFGRTLIDGRVSRTLSVSFHLSNEMSSAKSLV